MDGRSGAIASSNALEAITAQNKLASPVLRLPAEIRNQIYGCILSNNGIKVCHKDRCGDGVTHSKDDTHSCSADALAADDSRSYVWAHNMHAHFSRSLLRLLGVSKQIYEESKLLVFSTNVLQGNLGDIIMFLDDKILDSSQMSAVKVVEIQAGMEFCYDHGCITGKLFADTSSIVERLDKLQGLERVSLRRFCLNAFHQRNKKFGMPADGMVIQTVRQGDRTVEVDFELEKRCALDYVLNPEDFDY